MSKELSTNVEEIMCIVTFSGIRFYFKKNNFKQIATAINNSKFITVENNLINVSDIAGVYEDCYVQELDNKANRKLELEEEKLRLKKLGF